MYQQDYVRAVVLSRRRMKILMRTGQAANDLVATRTIKNVQFSIPQRLVEVLGVAHIELEVDEDDLANATTFDKGKMMQLHNPKIVETRRMRKRVDGVDKMLTTVVVTFEGQKLPTHLIINQVLYPVKEYVYHTRQCRKCWRMGHGEKNCRGKARCKKCAQEITTTIAEHACEVAVPVCINCKGNHEADDTKACPKAIKRKEDDQKRKEAHSQGKTDWFSTAGLAEETSVSQPVSTLAEETIPAPSTSGAQSKPAKRKCLDDNTDDSSEEEEIPRLTVHIEEGIRNTIQQAINSDEATLAISGVLGAPSSEIPDDQLEDALKARLFDILAQRTDDYIGTLRGVLVAARTGLNPTSLDIPTPQEIDAVACQVRCRLGKLTIVSVYIHPNTVVSQNTFEDFFNSIPQPCILAGDWNAKNPAWGGDIQNQRGTNLLAALDVSRFVVLNDGSYTRFDANRLPSAIDLTIASADISLLFEWAPLDFPYGSDHLPITFGTTTEVVEEQQLGINYKRLDWEKFSTLLDERVKLLSPTASYEVFFGTVWRSLTDATPTKSSTQVRKLPQPYWDTELQTALEDRRDKFRAWRRKLDYESYCIYTDAEQHFKVLVNRKQRESWRSLCDSFDSQTSVQKLWRLGRRYKNRVTGANHRLRDEVQLNKLLDKLAPPSTSREPLEFNQCSCRCTTAGAYFTTSDLDSAIKPGQDTAPGVDGICYSVMRNLPSTAKRKLLCIYNDIFDTGRIPEAWKVFKVIPILKPGKPPSDASSFRPIALASCFRKCYENMIKEKIEWYIESNKLFPHEICGFRKGKGTLDALHILVDQVQLALNNNQHVIACSVDVEGAYDNVQIEVLVAQMRRLGISECLVKAVYSLFKERLLYAVLDGNPIQRMTWVGLPQGSPLSPLCFNIVIFSLFGFRIAGVFYLDFADDITVACRGANLDESIRNIQTAIDEVVGRINALALRVAPSKCSSIIFSRRAVDDDRTPVLTVDGSPVPYLRSIKLLGLHLTPTLSWRKHFLYVKHRAATYTNFMRSVAGQSWGADPAALLTIFKSCIRPILEYASIFFTGAPQADTIILDRIQWSCIRIALGSTKTTHTGSLEVLSGLMPLKHRREMATMKFVERRFSLLPWHERFVNTTLEGQSSTWIRRNILQYRAFSGWLGTKDTLPCFQFDLDTRRVAVKVDLSVHRAMQEGLNQPASDRVEAEIQRNYPNATLLATDGSKDGNGVGYAVVDSRMLTVHSTKTHKLLSIFHAELLALRQAVEIIAGSGAGEYVVLTDSLSSLMSLSNSRVSSHQPSVWFEIKRFISQISERGATVTFMWVPAHRGVPLNETADRAANQARITGGPDSYNLTSLDISFPARKRAMEHWQLDWDNGTKGRFCNKIVPTVDTFPWFADRDFNRREIVVLSKLISNHSRLPAHLWRNNIVEDASCQCGESSATPDHLLFTCDLYDDNRHALWRAIVSQKEIPDLELVLKSQNDVVLRAIVKFFDDAAIDL
ncbi:hypothetical protein pipiens_002335 [Culex pipiens pipiens]|uniref:Uncharacterized protein n=1 Tax=Culex pipiens pipiens TaxID=38569 RepID=A0ABD1DGK2_CULPP